jgi:hypothetical protein
MANSVTGSILNKMFASKPECIKLVLNLAKNQNPGPIPPQPIPVPLPDRIIGRPEPLPIPIPIPANNDLVDKINKLPDVLLERLQ